VCAYEFRPTTGKTYVTDRCDVVGAGVAFAVAFGDGDGAGDGAALITSGLAGAVATQLGGD
jgi:hypothetical protein